jgi:hypothetical protein
MNMPNTSLLSNGLEGPYELLRDVKGAIGNRRIEIGRKFQCRFCGTRRQSNFRTRAHTFPEALGNKWVFSRDECDVCNQTFSLYETALAAAVGPFLTLGGVKGKGNKIRQTGRTEGGTVLQHRQDGNARPQISSIATGVDPASVATFSPDGKMRLRLAIADVRFRPRHAYKALSKMGFALLPEGELPNYQKLKTWLLDTKDDLEFPALEVAMSFASVGRRIPLVSGSLLRRVNPKGWHPHILFIFCAGSVCFQIDLLSDHLEDHIPPVPVGSINIRYAAVLGDSEENASAKIQYVDPVHLNWSRREAASPPIKELVLDFDPTTTIGSFTPIFR